MKKLISLFLALLLLTGCAETFDGPTVEKPMLTEYTVDHYYAFFDFEEVHYTERTVYAYDIYGNRVREMEYRDDELQEVTNLKYDDRGNCIRRSTWDHSGWIPLPDGRTERTYDEQGRVLSYVSYNGWGRMESRSWYSYDDEQGVRTYRNEKEELLQTTWYDENGNGLREVSGEYETIYEYDDRGNRLGWTAYKNGVETERYEAVYDEKDRQVLGTRYDGSGALTHRTEYIYDDERNTMTYTKSDGGKRIEYYHADGWPHMIEDYDADGTLSMLQRYDYRDILVPVEGGA